MNLNLSLANNAVLALLMLLGVPTQGADSPVQFHITEIASVGRTERTPLVMVCEGDHPHLAELADRVRALLEYSGHITVRMMREAMPRQRHEIARHFTAGNPFVLYLHMQCDEEVVHGRLYDTLDVVMLQGTKWARRATLQRWAQAIAHDVWSKLLGTPSSFLSSLAYVKRTLSRHGSTQSELCVADWDGAEARTVVRRPAIILAPVWLISMLDDEPRQLLFSEFTMTSVRLMKGDERGGVRIVFDYGGTTVGASVADEESIIYCRSGVIWRYVFDHEHRTGIHTQLVHEKEPCACPVTLKGGDIIYGVKGILKRWWKATAQSSILVHDRFVTAPAVCEDAGLLVYSGRVKQHMQLFVAELDGSHARQVTFGTGDKIDPTVSPCGNFVAYCHSEGKISRICILNLLTQQTIPVTPAHDYCLCPAWSL